MWQLMEVRKELFRMLHFLLKKKPIPILGKLETVACSVFYSQTLNGHRTNAAKRYDDEKRPTIKNENLLDLEDKIHQAKTDCW